MAARLLVLGSAQDAGSPQLGGSPDVPFRTAASVALLSNGESLLIDVSPDIRLQYRTLTAEAAYTGNDGRVVDAICLTHGHMGHYSGLVHFGKEAAATTQVPLYSSVRMADLLGRNEPWATLVREGNIDPRPVTPGTEFIPIRGVAATPWAVPHRDELTDTLAYEFVTSDGSLLYVPDLDGWSDWPEALERLRGVDVALIDGSFFRRDEVAAREFAAIRHPPIEESVRLLEDVAAETRLVFTHLNHTNPAADPGSAEHRWVVDHGLGIASDGMVIDL